jgi:hypothetical protein
MEEKGHSADAENESEEQRGKLATSDEFKVQGHTGSMS